jgi:Zn-dependent peptidase ImmA (M78 family)
MLRNRRTLEDEARKLLRSSRVMGPPVPVEDLAKALGIDVRVSPGKEDVSGALTRDGGSVAIAINSAQHENRRRFTIAHEIGHFVLHKGTQGQFDESFRVNCRDTVSPEATNVDEIEANHFAAALLMPEDFLRRDLLQSKPGENKLDKAINSLAVRYEVSARAMELRLVNLGVISPVD